MQTLYMYFYIDLIDFHMPKYRKSDKKDDFFFTLLFKIFSDEKRMIFGIFKCVEKAIFMKSNCFFLILFTIYIVNNIFFPF